MVCKRKKLTKNKIVSTHISILSHFTLNVDFILETECVDQHQHKKKNKKKQQKHGSVHSISMIFSWSSEPDT